MKSDRILLIKRRAKRLERLKRIGIQLKKKYRENDIVYCKERGKFGRIIHNDEHAVYIDFNGDETVYFRNGVWTKEKEEFLIKYYGQLTNKELSVHLGCSVKVIEKKLSKLRLKRRFTWTPEKDEFLTSNIDKPNKVIAEELGTTIASVKGRLHRLKISGSITKKRFKAFKWTKEKDKFLIENISKPHAWLAKHFNINVSAVKSRVQSLKKEGLITKTRKNMVTTQKGAND